ncbi:MAG TPA: VWA domain-containing protein [Streptosporangiaceae bacterium]
MPSEGDRGIPEHDAGKRPTWAIVVFTLTGSVVAFAAPLGLTLMQTGRLQPTWPAVAALAVAVVLGRLFTRFPDLTDRLVRELGGALHSIVRWWSATGRAAAGFLRGRLPALTKPGRLVLVRQVLAIVLVVVLGAGAGRALAGRLLPAPSPRDAVPCGDPVELRVLTPPEDRDAVQSAADGFAADQARRRHCRPVHITVNAQVPFSDLLQGFATRWQDPSKQPVSTGVMALLGPPPDIWLPAATAEADYVAGRAHPDVTLDDEGSIATSPLVFAVPDDYAQRMAENLPDPDAPTWADLLAAAPKAGLRVARPDPTVSEAGVLATADLYRASHAGHRAGGTGGTGRDGGGDPGDRDRRAVEEQIASLGAPLSSAHDLLCAIRQNPAPVAVIVPEQALLDYDQAKPLGVGCSLPIARPPVPYRPFHPADARVLDYPFVRVTWQGQADAARDTMIDRFRSWLAGGTLQDAGFRDRSGHTESVQLPNTRLETEVRRFTRTEIGRAIAEYRRARLLVTVDFVIDVSGSMNRPTPERVSELDRARELVAQAVDFLGPSDAVGLSTFPGGRAVDDVTSAVRAEVAPAAADHISKDLQPALARLGRAHGGSTPLYNAIDDASKALVGKGDNPAVVVLTDGDDHVRGGIGAAELAKRLAAAPERPRIVMLATGPKGCDEPDVTALTATRTAVCYNATSGETDGLTSLVFAELRKGGSR